MTDEYINGYRRLSPILREEMHGDALRFWCPGCDEDHLVLVKGHNPWSWNGDAVKPTLQPSVLVEALKLAKNDEGRWTGKWVEADTGGVWVRCHSYVTDGMINFLPDCTHDKAGQTLPLPEWYTHETEGLPGRPKLVDPASS